MAAPYYPDPQTPVGAVTVSVQVTLDPSGALSDAAIYTSSGYDKFDAAAIWAARKSTFKPRLVHCQPVASTELFLAVFNPPDNSVSLAPAIPVPRYSPGSDWLLEKNPSSDFNAVNAGALGHVVNSWRRGDETMALSEYLTGGNDVSLDRAVSFVETRLERVMEISNETTKVSSLCRGTLPAEELSFGFVGNKIARQGSVFVTVARGAVYTFEFSMPFGTALDPTTPPEISEFCA